MLIAICEDDNASREYENLLIHQWAEKNNLKITVDSYSSAENFLFESEDKIEYDLLLLDIQMGKMNGFELAKTLRKRGFSGSLAFLTGITDYAVEGYEVGAVRYILKPVKEQTLFGVLDLVYADYAKRSQDVFILQIGTDVSKIPFENIVYVEARGHYVHLCGVGKGAVGGAGGLEKHGMSLPRGELCVAGDSSGRAGGFEKEWKATFSAVAPEFEGKGFFCLRRGLLVNLAHVQKITKTECIMDNGEVLPVARNNYDDLNRAFIDFYREKSL